MGSKSNKDKTRRKKKWLRRLIVWVIVLALIAAGGMFFMRSRQVQQAFNYVSYTASVGSISNSLSYSGNLQLIDSATYTANGKTTVREVYVSEGDTVTEGDKLMRLANGQTIEAEFDGRVNKLFVEVGDEVAASASLIQIADFAHMQVAVSVDEYDIAQVKAGQSCIITLTATEQTYPSVIDSIDYISNSNGSVAYYTATAYVDVDESVYPGMQATLTIPQEEAQDVVILKVDALSFDVTNQAYVLIRQEDGTMQQVKVEVGVSNGNYVEIVSGLSDGDVVWAVAEDSTAGMSMMGFGMGGMGGMMNTEGMDMTEMQNLRQQRMNNGGGMPSFGGGGQ